jgi:hypothetical protein
VFTTELYTSSVASGALNQVTPVYSGVVTLLNTGFNVPRLDKLGAVYGVGLTARRLQVQSPSLRTAPFPDFVPVNVGAGLFESPVRGVHMMRHPIQLTYGEELDMFAVVGTTHIVYSAIWLTDGPVVGPPPGDIRTVHATAAVTLNAGAYTTVALTLDQSLKAGMYALVGARFFTATGVIFKMIPTDGPIWQPGGIAVQAYDGLEAEGQRYGGWGEWMRFQQNTLPTVNVFATAADTAQEAWLDLVKIG